MQLTKEYPGTLAGNAEAQISDQDHNTESGRFCKTVQLREASESLWSAALEEVARQHGSRPPARQKPYRPERIPLSDPNAKLWQGPLIERIDRATIFGEPLRIDGLDLLRLIDEYLPFWLTGPSMIVASDVSVGRYIKKAYDEAGLIPPPIYVEGGHGG